MPSISSPPGSASVPWATAAAGRFAALCACIGALTVAVIPLAANADPIKLQLAYFGADGAPSYVNGIKPFVDAVNSEGKGLVEIQVHFGGALVRPQAQLPQLVLDGGTDIALLVPGITPYRFPDNGLLDLPGLFQGPREGTLVYSHLIADKVLRGYDNYVVIGAYTTEPNVIHSRKPIDSLAALKGQRIRVNNGTEADALAAFGATPTVLEVPRILQAIRAGAVDGTTLSPTGAIEFGISRVAPYHFLLRLGTAPLVLVMNRKRFDGLPKQVQMLIDKYRGKWTAVRWATAYELAEKQALAQLNADPTQHVVTPSPADVASAQLVYQALTEAWVAKSPRNRELLRVLRRELAAVRSGD
jgi:TRAP-type C4-dicarboxylate transport system substrate-binding protein